MGPGKPIGTQGSKAVVEDMLQIDPRMTFDAFVVGPANRLASAAARRVAESPGTSYNPLFMYAASGLGKSHLLGAIANRARQAKPDATVVYQTLEGFLGEMTAALAEGRQDALRRRYQSSNVLLLDDVQFLTGQTQAQELLLRTVDSLTTQGGQVVLASDRPPADINGLDSRLLSRFSGGLIVDIAAPDYETRVAIVRRKADERDVQLEAGVSEVVARHPFRNVRELQGALNRLLAVQDLEGRPVGKEDVQRVLGRLMGQDQEGTGSGSAVGGPSAPAGAGEPEWKRTLRVAVDEGERVGVDVTAIQRLLDSGAPPEDPDAFARDFLRKVERVAEIRGELKAVGDPWPEAADRILRDPHRLDEAEALLVSARERTRPFPSVPEGPGLEDFQSTGSELAVKAAHRMVSAERPDYNPVYLVASDRERARGLLEAAGRTFRADRPDGRVALVSLDEFAEDYIRAISADVAGAWRERWWDLDLLLVHGLERLMEVERAQEEFFHLFEALIRKGSRMLLVADRAPDRLDGVDERLRSRFEGGLLVELDDEAGSVLEAAPAPEVPAGGPSAPLGSGASDPVVEPAKPDGGAALSNGWRPGPENVVWRWPRLKDRIVEEGP